MNPEVCVSPDTQSEFPQFFAAATFEAIRRISTDLAKRLILMKRVLTTLAVALCACALLAGRDHRHSGPIPKLGAISFPVSCSKPAQNRIEHGLALLHSFLFDDAEAEFEAATTEDSTCAMAFWAEAIGLYRPLAYRPGDADVKRGWELIQQAQTLDAKTPRERDYINAAATFYRADVPNHDRDYDTRNHEYSATLERLCKAYPNDPEAAVFYALSLLTFADSQDPVADSEKAIAILTPIFRDHPNHPGVAHYLIHAADSPRLAPKGLEAARRYAQIAPAAPHALHMPSHIFARLGLWQEDIQSNLASLDAARHSSTAHVGAEHQLHAMEFLEYAYLQIGEDAKAEQLVKEQAEIGYEHVDKNLIDYVNQNRANSPAMFYLETRNWPAAAALNPDPQAEPYNQAITYWARAVAAGHLHNLGAAQQAVQHYDALLEATRQGPRPSIARRMSTKHDEAHAWLAFVQGKDDEALGLLRRLAAKQDLEGKGEVELPAHEMLADLLREMRRTPEALAEFEKSLLVDPNRFNGVYGAGQAAESLGHNDEARGYYAQLIKNCSAAPAQRTELTSVRASPVMNR